MFREVENQKSHPPREDKFTSSGVVVVPYLPCPRIAGNGDGGPAAISGYNLRGERKGGGVGRLWVGGVGPPRLLAGGGLDCPRRRRRLYLLSGVLSSSARLDCAYRRTGTGRVTRVGGDMHDTDGSLCPAPRVVDADRDGATRTGTTPPLSLCADPALVGLFA